MSQVAWLMHTLGEMRAEARVGFQEMHRRLDIQDRNDVEWRRHMLRRMEQRNGKRNGNGSIPYGRISVILLLIVIGTLGHLAPAALRAGLQDVLKIGFRHLTSG